MISLKDYQTRVLDALRDFFRQCSKGSPVETAFREVQRRSGRFPVPYIPVSLPGLTAGMPYVCLRVPTGGGKTLLACHAVGLAMAELLHAEHAVVLWLVPSNTILNQTADALRDPRHSYRRAECRLLQDGFEKSPSKTASEYVEDRTWIFRSSFGH